MGAQPPDLSKLDEIDKNLELIRSLVEQTRLEHGPENAEQWARMKCLTLAVDLHASLSSASTYSTPHINDDEIVRRAARYASFVLTGEKYGT